jgi:demethylmenaquinone methyltransferase/2-methoxy-6-polyprenyl-1,4-benzoquinol methylase
MNDDPYHRKAAFFDGQIDAPWAAGEYGPDEWRKLDRLKAELGPLDGRVIVEPGCGAGRLTEVLSAWVGPSGRVIALDISPKMVERAEKRLVGRGNVSLSRAALEELDRADQSVDVVLHHQVFPHYLDQARALAVSAALVKPGGRVVVFHFINLAQINDTHRKAGTVVEHDTMPPEADMRRLFSAAGLKVDFISDDDRGYFLSARRPAKGHS